MKRDQDDIKVSVLVWAYNHEQYIAETLEHILSQKCDFKFEILVHDDASTDNTEEIISEYVEKYPQIIFPIFEDINQFSVGRYFDFCGLINGKYVATCEGDDYWTDDYKLQRQYDFLRNNLDYIACVHQTIRYNCNTKSEGYISKYLNDCDVQIADVVNGIADAYHFSSLMVNTDAYEKRYSVFPNIMNFIGDVPTGLYLTLTGKVRYIGKIMSLYREFSGESSWTNQNASSQGITEKTQKMKLQIIELYKKADAYSEYKYHNIFENGIADQWFACCNRTFEKGFLKDKYLRIIFDRYSLVDKCYIWMKVYFPNIMKRISKNK